MTEKPILFSGPMVRAILDGRKTMTRRVVKFPPKVCKEWEIKGACDAYGYFGPSCVDDMHGFVVSGDHGIAEVACPHGAAGSTLWVRETFVPSFASDDDSLNGFCYAATNDGPEPYRWKPSIFMPRWASRITLEITGVRVERLQDISEADAIAEGTGSALPYYDGEHTTGNIFVNAFAALWSSINGDRKDKHGNRMPYGWADSPWVWVIEFKMINQKEEKC